MPGHQPRAEPMSEAITLQYDELPAITSGYLKALFSRSEKLQDGNTIPPIEARIRQLTSQPAALSNYREVCGFSDSDKLPVSYPHVLAFPLHLKVMTHEKFPLKLLGLVHIRNSITQYKAIGEDEAMDIQVYVDGHRDVEKGLEFDLVTRVFDGTGELRWESTSTMLSRGRSKASGGKKQSKDSQPAPEFGRYASWAVPSNIGRRYARQAGDINPIHLSMLSARLFGFPKAIAHGMWLLARTAAALQKELPENGFRYDVAFKLPVLLPNWVLLKYGLSDQGVQLALLNENGKKPHMYGEVINFGHTATKNA